MLTANATKPAPGSPKLALNTTRAGYEMVSAPLLAGVFVTKFSQLMPATMAHASQTPRNIGIGKPTDAVSGPSPWNRLTYCSPRIDLVDSHQNVPLPATRSTAPPQCPPRSTSS